MIIGVAFGCAPAQTETASHDSTTVTTNSVAISDNEDVEDASMYDADPGEVQDTSGEVGVLTGDEYEILHQSGLVSDPFDFSLDSAYLQEVLGEDAIITSSITPPGEDEEGTYDGYSFYEVSAGKTQMSFYSYSGKHYADIYTPALSVANGVAVGMTKQDFVDKMGLGEDAIKARKFTINDDYGSMSFFFADDKLTNIYVSYEEGD